MSLVQLSSSFMLHCEDNVLYYQLTVCKRVIVESGGCGSGRGRRTRRVEDRRRQRTRRRRTEQKKDVRCVGCARSEPLATQSIYRSPPGPRPSRGPSQTLWDVLPSPYRTGPLGRAKKRPHPMHEIKHYNQRPNPNHAVKLRKRITNINLKIIID